MKTYAAYRLYGMGSQLLLITILICVHLDRSCVAWCPKSTNTCANSSFGHLSGGVSSFARSLFPRAPSGAVVPPLTQHFLAPQQLGAFETLSDDVRADRDREERGVVLINYAGKLQPPDPDIPFELAWDWQKCRLERHLNRLKAIEQQIDPTESCDASTIGPFIPTSIPLDSGDGRNLDNTLYPNLGLDTVYMLQHSPVYTLGTGSDERFVLALNSAENKVPVIRMDRGGEVTYHGPGQLTVYPILDLRNYRQDIHWYMRALEEAILVAISKVRGLGPHYAERQDDTTGIWIDNFKVAAVGIKCKRWITMHGIAVNVESCSLKNFEGIVPCGLEGRKVGCLNQFIPDNEPKLTVAEFAKYMAEALEEVFCINLVEI